MQGQQCQAMILLPHGTTASLHDAMRRIQEYTERQVPNEQTFQVKLEDVHLVIARETWSLTISFDASPYVIEESREIMEQYAANLPNSERLLPYPTRFDITSRQPDPDMEYFNDYVLVLEVLSSYPGAKVFDPGSQAFY